MASTDDAPTQPDARLRSSGAATGTLASPLAGWAKRHWVPLAGLAMVAADVIWRVQFLSHFYFRQDDFENLDFAARSTLSWHYLSFTGWSHFSIGARLLAWLLTREQLYDWPLARAVSLIFLACAGLAALRVLHMLFGKRPAILIPLAVYLLCPLTLPSLAWWTGAIESLPLQLAIFMALDAHVRYVRAGRVRQLAAAAGWVAFGLLFSEKAMVLPLLLFAVTAAFMFGRTSLLAGAGQALRTYWRAWAVYVGLLAIYAIALAQSLQTSATQPQAPVSVGAVVTFSWNLVKDTLLPGAIGGPWQWYPVGVVSLAAAPAALTWLAMIVAAVVVGASIVRRRSAWRAWAILAGWVAIADMLPVIIAPLSWYPILRALDAHYVSDAVPVLALAVGFAFLPLAAQELTGRTVPGRQVPAPQALARQVAAEGLFLRLAAGLLAAVFFGSIWSAVAYTSSSGSSKVASYMGNARLAMSLVPWGTAVLDYPVPANVLFALQGRSLESNVIGDLAPGKVHWVTAPSGNGDGLRMFGPDGRLYLADVVGASSPAGNPCWPDHDGQIVVRFWKFSPGYTRFLRIDYLWGGASPGSVYVQYGSTIQLLEVRPGTHIAYLPVSGSANFITIAGMSGGKLCIGDAEAGDPAPNLFAGAIPAAP